MVRQVYLYSAPLTSLTPWVASDVQVVLPNRLASRTLGVEVYTTLDALAVAMLKQSGREIADPLITAQLLREAGPGGEESLSPLGALPCVRELLDMGPALDTLSPQEVPMLAEQVALAQRYRQSLRAQNLVDSAERFWQAAECAGVQLPLVVYGYPFLDKALLTFLHAVAAEGSCVFLPALTGDFNPELSEMCLFLESHGWTVSRVDVKETPPALPMTLLQAFQQSEIPSNHDKIAGRVYASVEAEVRGVLGNVKQQIRQGVPCSDIVLIPSDLEVYQSALKAVAWEYGLPLSFSGDVSLSQTQLGQWLLMLADVQDSQFPYESTLRFLQHPLGPGLSPEQLKRVYLAHPTSKSAWQSMGVEELNVLDWSPKATRQGWVETLCRLLNQPFVVAGLSRWPWERQAAELLQETLHRWAALEPEESMWRSVFLQDVALILEWMTVPMDEEIQGIQVLTPFQVMGSQIPQMYLLGVAEGSFPMLPKSSPGLDFHLRNRLLEAGLPLKSLAKLSRQEWLRFYTLLQSPTQCFSVSYAHVAQGRTQLASPVFQRLGLQPTAGESDVPCSLEEAREKWLFEADWSMYDPDAERIRHRWQVEMSREFSPQPDDYDGVTGIPFSWQTYRFSATQLVSLGQCAFKWWAAYALYLADPDESDEVLSGMIRGSFYHKVLELAFEKAIGVVDPAEVVQASLEDAFEEAERQLRMATIIPSWRVMRLEHLARLREIVEAPGLYGEQQAVVSLEQSFETTWHGLCVRGKVDRIDRGPSGAVVIDYKTNGMVPLGVQDETGKALLDVQLPVYAEAAVPSLLPEMPVADAYYYSLTQDKVIVRLKPEQAPALAGFVQRAKQRLEIGDFGVSPDVEGKVCGYCPFDLVCRQGPRLANKHVPQDAEVTV